MSETPSPRDASPKSPRTRKPAAKKPRGPRNPSAETPEKGAQSFDQPQAPVAGVEIRSLQLTAVDRLSMIATAAYYRAERRRFSPGHELEDWLAAEADVEALLSAQGGHEQG